MNWDDLKIFLAVAQTGGLKKAARRLGLHHTSCARRLKSLEASLGSRLFDRLPGGYALTPSGEELLQTAGRIQDEVHGIEGRLTGQDLRLEGKIRVTMPNGFATNLLMADLNIFMERYPAVELEVQMTYSFRDLASREADVAIRHATHPPESLAGKRVARVHYAAYATPDYLAAHDPWRAPDHCHWLGWGKASDHLRWPGKDRFPDIPVRGNLYSDVMQRAAAEAGMGITSLPCFLGDASDALQRLDDSAPIARDWVWVLAHKDMMGNLRVRHFMEFLYEAFDRHRPLLEGAGT